MISLCMATYNGEKFIRKQLDCILAQTRVPDEVIICDDGSSDDTVKIIEQFIAQNQLADNWKLYCNEGNKGYPGNFYYAMSLCSGDTVFLADQDDLWNRNKVQIMSDILEHNPGISLLCCKYGMVDEKDQKLHSILNPAISSESAEIRMVHTEDVFRKYEWPGMVMAYRRNDLREELAALPDDCLVPHDILLCLLAAGKNAFGQLDLALAFHRRHGDNVAKEEHRVTKVLNRERKQQEIEDYLDLLDNIENSKILHSEEEVALLYNKKKSMQGRRDALASGSLLSICRNAWRDRKNVRFATFLCDFVIVKMK